MTCFHPSKIDVLRKAYRDLPRRADAVTVPCGTCFGCRTSQGRQWAIRLMHESVLHPTSSWFLTLTYDNSELPDGGTLVPNDTQLFLKRLRKKTRNKIGYYLCGEYGDERSRPHYHMATFGMEFLDKECLGIRRGHTVFRSDTLEQAWGKGSAEITTLTWKSASYVAGYVVNKVREKTDPTKHLRVDRQTGELIEVEKEFARMSKNPALGKRFLEHYWSDVYPHDYIMIDGRAYKPPKYYDRWMDEHKPEIMEEVKFNRSKHQQEIPDPELIMMEKVARSRAKFFGQTRGKIG